MSKLSLMQPYFFPYLGYFQLVQAVDHFVFYDDVQFIKGGWINRNRILVNDEPKYISAQLIGASSNKLINEIKVDTNTKAIKKTLTTLSQNYRKAPFFEFIYPIVETVYFSKKTDIAQLAAHSVIAVSEYLEVKTNFHFSSQLHFAKELTDRTKRLISINQGFGARTYINSIGGKELYSKEEFREHGIDLYFLNGQLAKYAQGTEPFIPGLSIIDVLMHNSKEEVLKMLDDFELV